MGQASAVIIGKKLLAGNDNLLRIDLSSNQLQMNFKYIVNGIKKNKRLIEIVMRNN